MRKENSSIIIENARLRLVIGEDAVAKSLISLETREELLNPNELIPFCSITEERPFNNEIKLAHPNKWMRFNANRARLEERLRNVLADNRITVDENRILTECAIFADKVAIDEELVRLDSHFSAFIEYMNATEPVGRKIDFLLQEMNRETNTIGSKGSDTEIARLVVEMKSELEKIREQIQNIE